MSLSIYIKIGRKNQYETCCVNKIRQLICYDSHLRYMCLSGKINFDRTYRRLEVKRSLNLTSNEGRLI